MDIFRDYFTREQLLASVAKAQYIPGRLSEFFQSIALTSTTLALEELPKNAVSALSAVARGTPSRVATLEKRNVHTFTTAHYREDGAVYADEVLNMRGVGVNVAVEVIQTRRDELMAKMRRSIDFTHEHLRTQTVLSPNNAFGSAPGEQSIALGTDATKTRAEIFTKIIKPMESALDGVPFSGIRVLCSDGYWASLIENTAIKATLLNTMAARELRNDPRENVFFGGVTFERHRGAGTIAVTTDKAFAVPEGVTGLFVQAFAPADTMDTVGAGQLGTPYHPQFIPSSDNRSWFFEMQTNCVMVCTRPTTILPLAFS